VSSTVLIVTSSIITALVVVVPTVVPPVIATVAPTIIASIVSAILYVPTVFHSTVTLVSIVAVVATSIIHAIVTASAILAPHHAVINHSSCRVVHRITSLQGDPRRSGGSRSRNRGESIVRTARQIPKNLEYTACRGRAYL
jgi:hypothetical protein